MPYSDVLRCARCDRPAVCWVRFSSRSTRQVLAYHPLCQSHAVTEQGLQATGCSMARAVFEPLDSGAETSLRLKSR